MKHHATAHRLAWLLCLPALVVTVAALLLPTAFGIREGWSLPWLADPRWRHAMAISITTSVLFCLSQLALGTLLGLALARLSNRRGRENAALAGWTILPWLAPAAVAALAWSFFWERPPGVRGANPWSEQPGLALALWWMADTWRHAPLVALFVYGAARRADPRLREAAALDGAWRRDRFWHLTLPGLTPALLLALVFLLPSALSSFDIPYTLSRGGTAGGNENAALYAWQLLAGEQRAQGAAVATSLLLLCVTSGLILLGAVAPLVGRRR